MKTRVHSLYRVRCRSKLHGILFFLNNRSTTATTKKRENKRIFSLSPHTFVSLSLFFIISVVFCMERQQHKTNNTHTHTKVKQQQQNKQQNNKQQQSFFDSAPPPPHLPSLSLSPSLSSKKQVVKIK